MPQTTDAPRLMTKAQAAAHCSVTPAGFGVWVKKASSRVRYREPVAMTAPL